MINPLNIMIELLQTLIPLIIGTILFSSTLVSKWRSLVAVLLFIGLSSPFIYSLFDAQIRLAIESDFGLGFPILFVWGCSFFLFIIALIRIYLKIITQKN